jgi:hypothetical protein
MKEPFDVWMRLLDQQGQISRNHDNPQLVGSGCAV